MQHFDRVIINFIQLAILFLYQLLIFQAICDTLEGKNTLGTIGATGSSLRQSIIVRLCVDECISDIPVYHGSTTDEKHH